MLDAMTYAFRQIYSIELSAELFARAQQRFADRLHIELLRGDSAQLLPALLKRLSRPALFWLDGHYQGGVTAQGDGDTPIVEELNAILSAPDLGHVLVIDDARHFGVDPGYPTVEFVRELVRSRRPRAEFEVAGDSIRIAPN